MSDNLRSLIWRNSVHFISWRVHGIISLKGGLSQFLFQQEAVTAQPTAVAISGIAAATPSTRKSVYKFVNEFGVVEVNAAFVLPEFCLLTSEKGRSYISHLTVANLNFRFFFFGFCRICNIYLMKIKLWWDLRILKVPWSLRVREGMKLFSFAL